MFVVPRHNRRATAKVRFLLHHRPHCILMCGEWSGGGNVARLLFRYRFFRGYMVLRFCITFVAGYKKDVFSLLGIRMGMALAIPLRHIA